MWITVVPSNSLAWYNLLQRMALTFVLDRVLGPPSLRGMTIWCRQTSQGSQSFVVSAINHLCWLCQKLSSGRQTPCTDLGFALCTSPVPGELRISCRSCCAVLGSRIDSQVRRYQRGVEKADSAGCAWVFSRLYTEEIFHGGYHRCFCHLSFCRCGQWLRPWTLAEHPCCPRYCWIALQGSLWGLFHRTCKLWQQSHLVLLLFHWKVSWLLQ